MPARTVRALVFDLDGTLADSELAHERALRAASESIGITFSHAYFRERCVGVGERGCFRMLASEHGVALPDETLERLVSIKLRAFLGEVRAGWVRPYPGAPETVRAAAASVPVAVCSGSSGASVRAMLESMGLGAELDAVVTSDDITHPKPHPEAYLLAAARLGIDPSEGLAVEDSPTGIESARRAGFRVVAVEHSFERSRLAGAEGVVGSLGELRLGGLVRGG